MYTANKIYDLHTHAFPDSIAARTITALSKQCGTMYYRDATVSSLLEHMKKAGVTTSVVLPVATKPTQTESINRFAVQTNELYSSKGIISFGGIHPDNENFREILKGLKQNGIKGIKLHPVYQGHFFDDIEYMRIVSCACEEDLIIVTHAGMDIGYPGNRAVTMEHILPVIKSIKPDKLILAHMGGWDDWDSVEEALEYASLKIDTAFSFTPRRHRDDNGFISNVNTPYIDMERFKRIVRKCGAENVFFGTDSPWSDMTETIEMIRGCGLSEDEMDKIFYKNAEGVLGL